MYNLEEDKQKMKVNNKEQVFTVEDLRAFLSQSVKPIEHINSKGVTVPISGMTVTYLLNCIKKAFKSNELPSDILGLLEEAKKRGQLPKLVGEATKTPTVTKAPPKKAVETIPTFINLIVDESGSMTGQRHEIIKAVNTYLVSLKKDLDPLKTRVTLTLFNDKVKIARDAEELSGFYNPLATGNYFPQGLTALNDAIGTAIRRVELKAVGKKYNVVTIIVTDGYENASKQFTTGAVRDLIEKKTKEGWTFVYLGADQDAFRAAQAYNIDVSNAATFSKSKMAETMSTLRVNTVSYATTCDTANYRGFGKGITP